MNSFKRISAVIAGLLFAVVLFAENVNLNFFFRDKKIYSVTVTKGSTYNIATLLSAASPAINMSDSVCRDYSFWGWSIGAPVEGDASVGVPPTTVTPQANTNIYAVFQKASTNRFIRVKNMSNLEANAQYMIVCYYFWRGEHQYYAMINEGQTYNDGSVRYNRVDADRVHPNAGIIAAPEARFIWTLKSGASADTWRWYNASADKWLRISTSTSNEMLVAEGNATNCEITVANGIFTIINHNNPSWTLKYVDDEITNYEDFFISGSKNDYPIYLYKKESAYTSYPDCTPWTVHLDALDGTIGSSANHKADLVETSAGGGVTLPSATLSDAACEDWTFAGWSVDAPVEGTDDEPAGLIPTGAYSPLYDGVTLYAVFTKTSTVIEHETIYDTTYVKRTSSLQNGKKYIIVYDDGVNKNAMGNTERDDYSYYVIDPIVVTVNGSGVIEGAQSTAIEWTWNSSNNRLQNVGNSKYIYPDYYQNIYMLLWGSGTSLTLQWYNNYQKWALYKGNYNVVFSDNVFWMYENASHYPMFDFYEQTITSHQIDIPVTTTTYNSYPHCAACTVHLHGCGGIIWEGSRTKQDTTKVEATAGAGILLPQARPICDRGGWEFYGWVIGAELNAVQDTVFTDFQAAGERFYPSSDNVHLYAIYKMETKLFRIIHGEGNIRSGDTYVITHFAADYPDDGKSYDWELSSVADGSYLTAVKGESPQNGDGYYIQTTDSAVMWRITGTGTYKQLVNLSNNEYFTCSSGGTTGTTPSYTTTYFGHCDGFAMTIGYSSSYLITYNNTSKHFETVESYTSGGKSAPWCYVYRRVKEFASWPHCDPFTVNFEGCGGTAEETTMDEDAAYEGLILPDAYVNADCDREGWEFAGWAKQPVTEETDMLTFDMYAAGTRYYPMSMVSTLYAVYQVKSNKFKSISTTARLHTGVNYIIATAGGTKYALSNDTYLSGGVYYGTSAVVTPNAQQIITNDNEAIEWRLEGEPGEYVLYNDSRGGGGVYLSLKEPGDVLMPHAIEDQFDITYSESKAYTLRSVQNIANGDNAKKYLGLSGSYFASVKEADTQTINFYRQQSNYNSYPNCIDDIDALKWETNNTGAYVTVESYLLRDDPDMHNSTGGDPAALSDGTYKIKYDTDLLPPCSKTLVNWDGTKTMLRIPYVVSKDTTLSALLNGKAVCDTCDIYVMPGKTLTIDADKAIHTLTVTDSALLNVSNGRTLTVNALVLFSEGDQSAPEVTLNSSGSIALKHGRIYHDRRIDEERYYWLSLPFDAQVREVSYANEASNGGIPVYRGSSGTDPLRFFVRYYNGELRAADVNGGALAETYWTAVAAKGEDYTMKAGQGYQVGIGDQKNITQADGLKHTHRVLRFTMRPGLTWLTEERNAAGSKATTVVPSVTNDERNAVHAGWNLIGNPYMHTYNTGSVPSDSKIRNGAWIMEKDERGDETGWWILDETDPVNRPTGVPYLTLFDPSKPKGSRYSQVLAASHDLRPFEAVFVQINEGHTINFSTAMNVSGMPAYKRFLEPQEPIRTGIQLSNDKSADKTGFVLSDEYSGAYEIGADLVKYTNANNLNLYSLDSTSLQLAFMGLSDEDAVKPIPLGVSFVEAGEYTFSFDNDWYNAALLDTIMLIDYEQDQQTNLKYANYTFSAKAGVNNTRFAILIRRAQAPQIATDLDELDSTSSSVRKVIINGHLFILKEDEMYNALGTKIR